MLNKDIIKKYALENTDFGFEMKVLRTLKENGWDAEHGGTYKDPNTSKTREFDIRASKRLKRWPNRFLLSVECKSLSPDFPLVVQVVPRSTNESFNEIIHYEMNGFQPSVSRIKTIGRYKSGSGNWVGKSFDQIKYEKDRFVSGEGRTFDKMTQALSSAAGLMYRCLPDESSSAKPRYLILPVLVIPDACLWRIAYNDAGDLIEDPRQVESVQYFVDQKWDFSINGTSESYVLSHLEIITFSALSKYLAEMTAEDSVDSMNAFRIGSST